MRRRPCSFCGKPEHEVEHVVVGRAARICNECIELCAEVNRAGVPGAGTVVLRSIGELATNDRHRPGLTGRIHDAAIVITDGMTRWVGPEPDLPPRYASLPTVDCGGRAALPGFVDAAAHVVYGGEQSEAFVAARAAGRNRLDGTATAAATAATPQERLREESAARLVRMLQHGLTTADARTGQGLGVATDASLLDIVAELAEVGPVLIPTLVVTTSALDLDVVLHEMMAVCSPRSRFVAVDCAAFDQPDAEAISKEAQRLGRAVRLTGAGVTDQLVRTVEPITVDDPDPSLIEAMRTVRSAAVLRPAHAYGGRRVDGRALADAGVTVALSAGSDPNSMLIENPQLAVAMAVVEHGLTADEAIWAATRGGAIAVDDERRGWLGRGAAGDVVVIDAPTVDHLAYRAGSNAAWRTFKAGRRVPS